MGNQAHLLRKQGKYCMYIEQVQCRGEQLAASRPHVARHSLFSGSQKRSRKIFSC